MQETWGILFLFTSLTGAQNKSLCFVKARSREAVGFLACKHPQKLAEMRVKHPAMKVWLLQMVLGERTRGRCGQGAVEDEAQEVP